MPDLLAQPLAEAEFLVVDTETNGRSGEECELTEVGAVLVGGGELHDRWEALVGVRAPLTRAVQRFTGITQAMVDEAPAAELVLAELAAQLDGRVLVAHSAAFDRRVLRQAFARAELAWPAPPVLCTVALARRFAPLVRQRRLRPLAEALGVEVEVAHRALADAETCARVLCALLPRLGAHAATVGDAVALLRAAARRRPKAPRAGRTVGGGAAAPAEPRPDVSDLPDTPGVYLFRNREGQVLYVGKSVALRTRARSHFAPSSASEGWTAQAAVVDHRATASELGALVLENRLIKELCPPGNVRLKHQDPYVYLRCRLDIAYPVLEVAPAPAAGHAVTIGPLHGRRAATELLEQLNSLFGLRHCGRALKLRPHPSAYGQMGRCLSPCLNDLDPNLYRRRLDEALGLFTGEGDGGAALLRHVEGQMREAAAAQRFERAAWLRRRLRRLRTLTESLSGVLLATHARPRLVLAGGPRGDGLDAFWLVGGRLADWGLLGEDVVERTAAALRGGDGRGATTFVPPGEVDELRIVSTWLAAHEPPALDLGGGLDAARVRAFVELARERAEAEAAA